jgi:predicted DNA-binding transcriptional regulator AlpA
MKEETVYLRDIALAQRYSVSRPTIWRWLKKGALPKPIKLPGGRLVGEWSISMNGNNLRFKQAMKTHHGK